MNANRLVTTRRGRRHVRRGIAAGIVGLLTLTACTSDPGPRRVAQDIINAEAETNPDLDKDCLLARLDDYSNSELEAIANGLDKSGSDDEAQAKADLEAFKADLETCTLG